MTPEQAARQRVERMMGPDQLEDIDWLCRLALAYLKYIDKPNHDGWVCFEAILKEAQ